MNRYECYVELFRVVGEFFIKTIPHLTGISKRTNVEREKIYTSAGCVSPTP